DLRDLQRLEDHDFALQIPENQDALGVALIRLGTHPVGNISGGRRQLAACCHLPVPLPPQFIRNAGRCVGRKSSSSSASCEMAESKSCPSYSVVYVRIGMSFVSASSFSIVSSWKPSSSSIRVQRITRFGTTFLICE